MRNLRLNALAIHLGVDVNELKVSSYNELIIEYGNQEYLVVTDDEADDLWEEDLNNYLDEIVLPELPLYLRGHFDDEAWKRDARYDGRAHSLSRYDGNEEEITVYEFKTLEDEFIYSNNEEEPEDSFYNNDETFYIYRQN